jgi:predicted secreted protein
LPFYDFENQKIIFSGTEINSKTVEMFKEQVKREKEDKSNLFYEDKSEFESIIMAMVLKRE